MAGRRSILLLCCCVAACMSLAAGRELLKAEPAVLEFGPQHSRGLKQYDCAAAETLCKKADCGGRIEFECDGATGKTSCLCYSAALAGCFPGAARAALPGGASKPLSQLALGDSVLAVGADGALRYSPVVMFSSRRPQESAAFVRVRTNVGLNLTVTPGHYLFAWRGAGAAAAAKAALQAGSPANWPHMLPAQLAPGDYVPVAPYYLTAHTEQQQPLVARVTAVEEVVAEGVYMPHTLTGAIVVDGVVATELTSLVPPSVAPVLAPYVARGMAGALRLAYAVLPPSMVELAVRSLSMLFHGGAGDAAVSHAALLSSGL